MALRDYTLYDILVHNGCVRGDAVAVVSSDESVSHREFLDRVDELSTGISALGISQGDRICVLAQNSIEYLVLYGACARMGLIAYPINWRLSAEEVKHVVALADPKMLVVGAAHVPQLAEVDASGMHRVLMGKGSVDGFMPMAELYDENVTPSANVHSHDPFVVISTAAVAGVPRGAVLSHQNVVVANYLTITGLGLSKNDCNLAAMPFFHILGLGLTFAVAQAGGKNAVLEKFDPAQAVKMMDEHDVTLIADFPPILSMLLEARKAADAQWKSLTHVVGLDSPDVIKRLYTETNAKFWTGFGQSETSGMVTSVRVDQKPGATGKPVPLVRVRCVNDAGEEVPVGEVGEIAVQGPVVFQGYWRDPDATAYTFRNGWHHTGDLGRFDADGYLYYAGRKPEKDLIKSGGENVYPAEVEQVLIKMTDVAAVCVIGVSDAKWGEAVKAVIEPEAGHTLTGEQVTSFVAERIASYKKPRYVDFVEKMPRKDNGDMDRIAVKAAHG